jgi:hypothetical protein
VVIFGISISRGIIRISSSPQVSGSRQCAPAGDILDVLWNADHRSIEKARDRFPGAGFLILAMLKLCR